MNPLAQKWDKTGLLDGMTDFRKNGCAVILEDVARILIETTPKENKERSRHEHFCGYILPMVKVGYNLLYPQKFPDVVVFVKDFEEFFNKNESVTEVLKSSSNEDVDVFCELYEPYFIKTFMKLRMAE